MTAKYHTRRNPALVSVGRRAGFISQALGAPFMPWQQHAADVALEVMPITPADDGYRPGAENLRWRYRLVVISVPRQSGKTTLLRAVSLDRAMAKPAQQIFVTAQTGKDARARWRDWAQSIESSPLGIFAEIKRGAGSEQIITPNKSFVSPFAPTPRSLHGYTPPLVMVDEGWAFDEAKGAELEAAINPAQITLPDRQLWIVSTMGDAASTWFHRLVDQGRASIDDPTSDMCYIEYSADESIDPYDPAVLDFHPALGHTQTRDDLIAQATRESRGNWVRGYLNLRTQTRETIIDLDAWDSLTAPEHDTPPLTDCVIGYAVDDDRTGSSVWAAHMLAGIPCLHLVATRTGSAWLAPVVQDLHQRGAREIVADDTGHTRAVTATLDTLGIDVRKAGTADYVTACSSILGRITDHTIQHDAAPELRTAIEAAALRPMAGGRGFVTCTAPIDNLKAATLAAWRAEHLPTLIPIW